MESQRWEKVTIHCSKLFTYCSSNSYHLYGMIGGFVWKESTNSESLTTF